MARVVVILNPGAQVSNVWALLFPGPIKGAFVCVLCFSRLLFLCRAFEVSVNNGIHRWRSYGPTVLHCSLHAMPSGGMAVLVTPSTAPRFIVLKVPDNKNHSWGYVRDYTCETHLLI